MPSKRLVAMFSMRHWEVFDWRTWINEVTFLCMQSSMAMRSECTTNQWDLGNCVFSHSFAGSATVSSVISKLSPSVPDAGCADNAAIIFTPCVLCHNTGSLIGTSSAVYST